MKDALTEAIRIFDVKNPTTKITPNYGASGALKLQIEQGAPVDIFISAASDLMDDLASKNLLLMGTRVDLLQNELALIVPSDSRNINSFRDLERSDVRNIALGDPRSVPAGTYAQQVLTSLGSYEAVKRKAVIATDVRQVLAYVESGSAQAGLVYATDAAASTKVRIVVTAPPGSHQPIVYPAAALRNSKNPDAAKQFVDFLKSPEARAIFTKYGFQSTN